MVHSMGLVSLSRSNKVFPTGQPLTILFPLYKEIDITIMDALKRPFQCATIQLDFNLPVQFKLSYRTGEAAEKTDGQEASKDLDADRRRPVMIHRAILGSLERFIAIITEHFGGKW